jgi:hypothetical protein
VTGRGDDQRAPGAPKAAQAQALEALAAFAPVFADPDTVFGSWVTVQPADGEASRLPFVELTDLAARFLRTCAEHGWVRADTDWAAWSATPEAARLRDDPGALGGASSDDLADLLTALVRGDLFDDGRLLWAFESGLLRRITERAAVLARAGDIRV